jgi:hypothetical protein
VTLLVAMNAHMDPVQLWLPPCRVGTHWEWVIDTDRPDGLGDGRLACGTLAEIAGHSVIVMVSVTEPNAEPPALQPPAAQSGAEQGVPRPSEPPPPPTPFTGVAVQPNIPPRRASSRPPEPPQVPNPTSQPGAEPSEKGGPKK